MKQILMIIFCIFMIEMTLFIGCSSEQIDNSAHTNESYYIAFDANNGIGEMNRITLAMNEEITLPNCLFNKKGYYFKYWNTRADGTGVSYPNNAIVSNMTDNKGSMIVLCTMGIKGT